MNHFQWQAEPVGNNTTKPAATLNLLYGTDPAAPVETGLRLSSSGIFTFATGQTFPGTGNGTITGVTAGTDLTGGGTSGNVTLNLNVANTDARYAQLAAINTFANNQEFGANIFVQGDVNAVNDVLGLNVEADWAVSAGSSSTEFVAGAFANNGDIQTLQVQNFANPISGFTEAQFDKNNKATFYTDALGDTTATGTKSAAVPLENGQMVKVFSMKSPEVWFEDFGSGQLRGGSATISLDPEFVQTVDMAMGYHVFVTPKGDCKGLFLANETKNGFEVRELGGGKSSVEFDYRIVAHRKGYEETRLPVAVMPKVAVVPHRASRR